MSEEEIVNEFKSIINSIYLQGFIKDNNGKISTLLKNLLDLYNKEKETSHFIQSQLDIANAKLIEEKEKNIKLNEKFRYAVPDDMISEKYISKDKIREKIEIYRIAISDSKDGDFIHDIRQKIQVLKELLEE